MRWLFSSLAVTVQVSDQYVTTGLITVLYTFILVFFFRSFDFIGFELAEICLVAFCYLLNKYTEDKLYIKMGFH
jgi:hypothetical protein